MSLSRFQVDALTFIINQYQDLELLHEQIPFLEIIDIEHTGVGCFYNYKLNSDYDFLNIQPNVNDEEILGMGCQLEAETLIYGASLTLFIKNKTIETLEILAHGPNFPTEELTDYSFRIVPVNIINDIKTN
jgi:hypothetical protein